MLFQALPHRIVGHLGIAILLVSEGSGESSSDFEFPPGFEVTEISTPNFAPDIYSMTLSPRGDIVVSSRGYVRVLKDRDHDGLIEGFTSFLDGPADGAMGMWWEGKDFYLTGEGGLWRYRDANEDDIADGPGERLHGFKTGDEHGAHAIRRGPDGWLYVLSGNEGRVDSSFATSSRSPISVPIAGTLVRFSPDFEEIQIVADGFRNAYDFDFNRDGEIFTYDSDNERDVTLPYFEPTRLYQVTSGFHYGWENPQHAKTWRMPPYFYDVDRPIATLGRGSPTGVVCYAAAAFPARYQGGLFLADWTFGRIYFCPLRESGSSYIGEPEVFLQSRGSNGFAPTDLEVDPESGDLLVSIGGRGTRGAVYRIHYPRDESGFAGGAVPVNVASHRLDLARLTDAHQSFHPTDADESIRLIRDHWGLPDRKIRQAVSRLIEKSTPEIVSSLIEMPDSATAAMTLAWGLHRAQPEVAANLLNEIWAKRPSIELQIDAVRLVQILLGNLMATEAIGSVWEGYSRRGPSRIGMVVETEFISRLKETFPSGNVSLDDEIARTFALLESGDLDILDRVLGLIDPESAPSRDIHFLAVLGRLTGQRQREHTRAIAEALLNLDRKVEERGLNRDRHWPLRLSEIYLALAEKDPQLNTAILEHPLFGDPDHLMFVSTDGFPKREAAERLIAQSEGNPSFQWTLERVSILGNLPIERSRSILRQLMDKPHLKETCLRFLATEPEEQERRFFFEGLNSWNPETVSESLGALSILAPPSSPEEWIDVLNGLKKQGQKEGSSDLELKFVGYLEKASGLVSSGTGPEVWVESLAAIDPRVGEMWRSNQSLSQDWIRRFREIDWSKGDPAKGMSVYERIGCAACHTGTRTLGPDLRGVAHRFSREDLWTAILDPSRDIPSQYQTLTVETADGEMVQGLVVYKAVDSILLQNGPDTTFRVEGKDIVSEHAGSLSVMPTGLLDSLTDEEIADLDALLRSLD